MAQIQIKPQPTIQIKAYKTAPLELFEILPMGDIYAILGDDCDPDSMRPVMSRPGFFTALWLKGGFTPNQYEAMELNPRVYLHTGVFDPGESAITHAVTFSILSEQSREERSIIVPLTGLIG